MDANRKRIMSRAHNAVVTGLRRGVLVEQPCEQCGCPDERNRSAGHANHAHHDDYSQPLNVRWLCGSCHKHHHLAHGPGLIRPLQGEAA